MNGKSDPKGLRGRLARIRRRLLLQPQGPLLSVIVPVYNVEEYLDECLDSIRNQDYSHIEIVVVDDGSPDGSFAIAERHARLDKRIKLIRQANGGLSVARNTGFAASSGEYVTFVDSDDMLSRRGLAAAMRVLLETGSDIAIAPYSRIRGSSFAKPAPWIRELHASEHRKATLVERPDMMVNALALSKVFRRSFWESAKLSFIPGLVYEDQPFTAQAFMAAGSIDILTTPLYHWRVRENSLSQGHATAENLWLRLNSAHLTLGILEPLPRVREERAMQYLKYNMTNSTLKLERADDAYLDLLIEHLPRIVGCVPRERFLAEVPAQFRVLYQLICEGRRAEGKAYVQAEGMQIEMHSTGMEPTGFTAYLPGWDRQGIDPRTYVLGAEQTRIRARVTGASLVDDSTLELAVLAYFQNVDFADFLPVATAKLEGRAIAVIPSEEEAIVESRQGAQRRYRQSGWTVIVDQLSQPGLSKLAIELELTAGPFKESHVVRFDPDKIKPL